MSIRTFWVIVLKVVGLFLIAKTVLTIPVFLYENLLLEGITEDSNIFRHLSAAATVGFMLFVINLFLFKTNWIIGVLDLDQGFDDTQLNLNYERKDVIYIALIILGASLMVNAIGDLILELYFLLKDYSEFRETTTTVSKITAIIKFFMAVILLIKTKKRSKSFSKMG